VAGVQEVDSRHARARSPPPHPFTPNDARSARVGGVVHVLTHLGAAVLLLAAFFLAGRTVLAGRGSLLRACGVAPPLTITLGMVLWMQLLVLLAFAQLYHAAILRGLALVVGSAGLFALARRGWSHRGELALPRGPELASLVAIAAILAVFFVLALDPEVAWDAAAYHLTLPKLFLEAGGVRRIDFFLFSTWPLNFELLFGLAMALQDYLLANALHFLCGALLVSAIFAYTRQRAGWVAGVLAACFFLMEDLVGFEIRIAYVELAQSLLFFLGFTVWRASRRAASTSERRVGLLFAGLLLGAMAGGKLTGAVGIGIVALLHILAEARERRPARLLADLVWLALPMLTLAAPWYLRSAYEMGDPLHPALYAFLRGGGDEWSAELANSTRALYAGFGMGRGPIDFALLPLRLTVLADAPVRTAFQGSASPLWALLLPLTAWGAWRSREVRALLAPALLFTGVWFLTCQSLRLLMPILPFLCCAAALSIALGVADWRKQAQAAALPAALGPGASWMLLLLVLLAHASQLESTWSRFGAGTPALIADAVPAHFRFVNDRLPLDARVLLVNTNQAFFCEREFVSDSLFEASQLNALFRETHDEQQLRALFLHLGVTHVVERRLNWGIDYPDHWLRARGPGRLLVPVYSDAQAVVYEVAGATGALSPLPDSP
jgi:hypothetical protein